MDLKEKKALASRIVRDLSILTDLNFSIEETRMILCAELTDEHRTKQQMIIGLILSVLKRYGDLPKSTYVDGRNEQSHEICSRIKDIMDGDKLQYI